MKKLLSVIIVLALLAVPFGSTLTVGAQTAVTYYAPIESLTASYDRNTEKVTFVMTLKNDYYSLLDGHSFVAAVSYDAPEVTDKPLFGPHMIKFSEAHKSSVVFEWSFTIGKAYFLSPDYSNWQLTVYSNKLPASGKPGDYYCIDSKTTPIELKPLPEGDFCKVVPTINPTSTPVGGKVELSLAVRDISTALTDGLTALSFTLKYDSALVHPEKVSFRHPKGDNWSMTKNQPDTGLLDISIKGEIGYYKDDYLTVTVLFNTTLPGTAEFSLTNISGSDAFNATFTNAAGYGLGTLEISAPPTPPTPERIKGDVNGDNKVNSLDAAMLLRADAAIITFADWQTKVGDVNGDGKVNSLDAARVLRYDAGLIEEL